jgi:hypothetical protein
MLCKKLSTKRQGVEMPIQNEQMGYIELREPPTQTNAGAETVLTFPEEVHHVTIYNGTSVNINYAFNETCTAGSFVLAPGYQLDKDKSVTTVHLLTASAVNVNGSSAGNIVVKGAR